MSSTRNKNTPSDYCLENKGNRDVLLYMNYEHSPYGLAATNALPTFGITPSHMPRNILSKNPIDIESSLFGINSTNLVTPSAPTFPLLTTLPEIAYFNKLPLYMPTPLIVQNNQRPTK
jgi:hypothetical protein